jgi:pimeloyl-ACP methyl ester carboxylesterase
MFDPRLGEELAAKQPNIRYRQLAGAGHSLHRDSPAQVLGALLDTIDDGV